MLSLRALVAHVPEFLYDTSSKAFPISMYLAAFSGLTTDRFPRRNFWQFNDHSNHSFSDSVSEKLTVPYPDNSAVPPSAAASNSSLSSL